MDIRPFRGWHYRADAGDVSDRIAPPYDVLSGEQKDALLARHEHNIVAVDLPHVPPKEVGPDEAYRAAADRLADWQRAGILVQDDRPAIYVYEQSFRAAGETHTRRAVLCGVRATELGEDVKPHEHTYAGPKADRLKLSEQTRMQLSPVFGFYRDPSGRAGDLLAGAAAGQPDLSGELHGVDEKLWIVTDEEVIADLREVLADKPAFIADGHHRYTTQLNYRNALRDAGAIDDEHEANFVLFALVEADDAGLVVLPTHRIVSGLREDFRVEKLAARASAFTWQRCSVDEADLTNPDAWLKRYGQGAMALMDAEPAEIWIARLTDPDAMRRAAPDEPDAWRTLDVAVLHKLLIDEALQPWRTESVSIDYTPEASKVLAACKAGRGQLGACLQATPLSAVEDIARAGGAMPHKSTYFYPKLATGMVLKPLE
ncbi:MAG: DUF1015 domain-containing protein [Phycisphaerae bacterium]|nr:DUF1015 domain-containing protein [Phycisphaerae bacterium]